MRQKRSAEYSKGFRAGLEDGSPGESFIEFIDADTFPLIESDRPGLRDYQQGYRDGRAARASALSNAGAEES